MERPNRSDAHLSREEEAKIEETTRDYFDSHAPKRHTKPQRSEYSKTYTDAITSPSSGGDAIPEHAEFQRLENHPPEKLVYEDGSQEEAEEFVETEYYKDLNHVDKQHHTTGTGFIAVESAKGESFSLDPDSGADRHDSGKGNPATNEWIPAASEKVEFASDKPGRSDN